MLLMSMAFENFELYNPTISLEMIVWSLCAGLGIGAVASFVNRRIVGGFVRRLLKDSVHTPEAAVTLADMGFSKNLFVRMALKSGKPLRRLVYCGNEDEMVVRHPSDSKFAVGARRLFSVEAEPEIVTDLARARFYIPEDLRITAELRYEAKGTTLPNLILSIVLLIAAGFAVLYILPELLTLLDNFLTLIDG